MAVLRFILSFLLVSCAWAQERFSPFVPTDEGDVVRMLKFAAVGDGDVVFDLGSGDGRIPMEAARTHPQARGRGIEIDAKLVAESRARAAAAGLAERVQFVHQNAFDADLSEATVITMWLWPEVMHMLRPKILAEARPGTRVLTRMWDLGSWPADETATEGTTLYKWIVPARVGGYWDWSLEIAGRKVAYSAIVEQHFQRAEGFVRIGNRRGVMNDVKVNGEHISFSLLASSEGTKIVRHQFSGHVAGDTIEGTVSVLADPYEHPIELPWRAQRVAKSGYFAPTGIEAELPKP